MGNTSSSNTSPSSSRTPRSQSPSTTRRARSPARNGAAHRDTYSPPPQQHPHPNRPLKHKKRSLELPDLASLTLTPAAPSSGPSKASSPIAIPTSAIPANYSRPKLGSTPQMSEIATIPPPTAPHLTKPPDPGPVARNSTFSLVGRKSNRPDDAVRKKFKRATIRASIAPGFTVPRSDESGKVTEEGPEGDQVSVYVSWKAGGQNVFLAGKYNNSWKGKVKLSYDPATQCHATTIYLPPGNHHIKFIVDDQWMLSDELPTCTDDDGNFVNYIDVSSNEKEWGSAWWGDGQDESDDDTNLPWTSVIPPHLPISAQMEENYLLQTSQSPSAYHHHMHPPPLPPPTPHPPTLPRHLDKVILNTRPIASSSSSARLLPSHNRTERSRQIRLLEGNDGPNGDDNSVLPVPSHSVVGHLSTSAIRNGVLAVGTTNRYKNKYITTIYYYPT